METVTGKLHRLTSYEPARDWKDPVDDPAIVQDLVVNDLDTLPWFFKRYPGDLPRVPLPRDLPSSAVPGMAVLSGFSPQGGDLTLDQLSRILYLSAAVVRTGERPYGTHPFRAAGSAGGRFPLEIYVAIPDGTSLPAGVFWYDPAEHALLRIAPPPTGTNPAIVVTGVPWRTGWRYRERGYRHLFWDLGTMLSQLLAAGESAGIAAALHSRFPAAAVTELVGADGVHEFPVAVVALGGTAPALTLSGPAAAGAVDAAPREFPLVTEAQRAGESVTLGAPWPSGEPVRVPSVTATVDEIILARGSQRRMDPARGLPLSLLTTSLSVALRGIDLPHFVAVHDVDGLAPGLYRWPDLSAPVRPGNLRDELYRVCLEQSLGRDAAFVVITAADLSTLDDAGYRDAQLAAGLVEGRLHLLAYASGAGASGMTFVDSEIPRLLGTSSLAALIFTCVGVPSYRNAKAGLPGSPVAVRTVRPRA